jgi:hypothetical protein
VIVVFSVVEPAKFCTPLDRVPVVVKEIRLLKRRP